MANTPNRLYDQRILNVGTRTGPPAEVYVGDKFLAGTSYVTGCNGATATNGPVPGYGGTPLGVFVEPDGTIKSYFVHGDETPIDSYCRNDGITQSKYDALSDDNKKNYCGEPIGGKYYLTDPNCGYVRETSRPVGVDIWYPPKPPPDPEDEPDCEIAGKLLSTVTVTGTAIGTGYGVGPYSIDSDIGLVAVHAGLINVGDTAKIRLKSHDQDKVANFSGSTRNGVTTFDSSGTVQGIIESVTIVDPGSLGSNSTDVQPLSVNGENAELLVTLNNSLQVVGVTVNNGGQNYQVGDTFEVTSLGFGPGVSNPALLRVASVRSATAGGGACAVDLELEELLEEKPDECEPKFEQKSITVDSNNAALRGPINGLRVKNPFANPNKVVNSLSETDSDYNWYESCPPVSDGEQEYIGQYTFQLTSDSPSFNEDHTEAKFTYNFTRYFDMTSGCCPAPSGGTITCQNSNRINWKVNSVKVDIGGDGFAVGDKFELKPKFGTDTNNDGYTNIYAIMEVINIEGQIVSGGTLNYIIEKDAQLVFNDTTKNKTIDLVRDYLPDTTTDEILINTAETVFVWCLENIFRPPTDIEFQYWIRQIYSRGGEMTPEIDTDMIVYFGTETQTTGQVQQILSSCDAQAPGGEDDPIDDTDAETGVDEDVPFEEDGPVEEETVCRWHRSTFFVPSQTVATNMKVKELWDFYGRPKGPSGPGGGVTNVDQFSNPRPEDVGLIQDNEADLSDLAGMTVWRWVPCSDGSNDGDALLGSYIEDVVPSPGIDENCNNQTLEDQYAIYNKDSKVYYNNNTSSVKNLVRETKTQQALQVNQMYLDPVSGLGRPADQQDIDYWLGQIAVDKVEDRHATYWNRAKVVWSGGKETEGAYVDQTKTNLANAVNDEYLNIVGRPADQPGLDYWVKEAERGGLDFMLVNLRAGLELEVETEGRATEFVYGYDRMLEHLADSLLNGDEKARGGVRDIKTYCEYQTTNSLDVSWFHDTRLPPWYGSVGLDGGVKLTPIVIGDNIYFKNFPQNQGDTKSTFASPVSTANHKIEFNNQYVCSWPTIKGQPAQGQPMPILVRYVNITWYSYDNTNGEVFKFELQDYNNDLLEQHVGPRILEYTPVVNGQLVDDMAGSFNLNNPDPTLQTIDLMLTDFKIRKFVSGSGSDFAPLSADIAKELSWDESPKFRYKMYPTVRAEALLINPETGELVPVGTRSDTLTLDSDTYSNRFFSAWGECTQCDDGTVACPPNTCPTIETCPDGTPPPCGPTGSCNPYVTCQSGNSLQVMKNQPTTLTFRFDVNTNYCSTQGTAKVSIRRWWPCLIFGYATPMYNSWMKDSNGNELIKVPVPVVDGTATFELPINTSKDDYQSVSYQDQIYDDPESCHWNYTAYWEYDHPNATCNQGAWENPGCDDGSGTRQLPEVLCVQKETCTTDTTEVCNDDCPACEQTFFVQIGETTECGPIVQKPSMSEGPYGPGINSGRFKTSGVDWIATPNFFATSWKVSDLQRKTDTSGEDYVFITLEAWVNVRGVEYDTMFTKGVDRAIDWNLDGAEGGQIEVDCNAQIRVVGQWYYKYFFENGTESELIPLNQYEKYNNAQNRSEVYEVEEDYWPQGSTEANAFKFGYGGESGQYSYFTFKGVRPVPIGTKDGGQNKGIASVGIYLSAAASNDEFGNVKYQTPPPGYESTLFGTDVTIDSPRPPWSSGTQGPGPKDEIFFIGKFSVSTPADFPTANWTGDRIDGCEDAQVYDLYDFGKEGGLVCGESGQPGSYSCIRSSSDQYQESWTNYDGTTGGSLRYSCDPWKNAPDPNCAPPLSSVVLQANNDDGGIFAADWKDDAPSNCGEGLRIIWYLDGVIRSGDYELDPGNRLSCGESTQDFSQWATDSNKTYTVEYIIVDNNIGGGTGINGLPTQLIAEKYVNFDWTSVYNNPDAKPYAYSNVGAWALKRGTRGKPIEITTKQDGSPLSDGDLWQVILGGASCTFQGNDGGGDKDLTGLKNPDFDIVSSDETWNGSNNNLDCYTAAERDCCDPVYAANNPTNRCEEEIIGVLYDCCDDNYGNGKLTARVNNANTAWPNIPGTQEKVVGTISYQWQKKGNNNVWTDISGGTGETITYTADGSKYRCTVTFDLTGKVPNGYTAKPIKTTTTKVFGAEETKTCPDGTVVPVETDCPNTCSEPSFRDSDQPEIYTLTRDAQGYYTRETDVYVEMGNTASIIVSGLWSGFLSPELEYVRATAQLRDGDSGEAVQTTDLRPDKDPNAKIEDAINFTGGFEESYATPTTKKYQVSFTIYYRCEGSTTTREVTWRFSNTLEVQWGGIPDPSSDEARCYYGSVYENQEGCGSYLAYWTFPLEDNPSLNGLYFMTPGSDVRGPKWSPNSDLKGNCEACPPVTQGCPTIDIKNILVDTLDINKLITLQVVFDIDMKGYAPKGFNGDQPIVSWTDVGTVFPSEGVYGAQVQVGPFTTPGIRTIQVGVAQQFVDTDRNCPFSPGPLTLYEYVADTLQYDLNIGGETETPPSKEPVITGSISGTSTVNMVGGSGTGVYTLDYTINDGEGYKRALRDVAVGWDGAPTRQNNFDYEKTFNQAGNYDVVAKVAVLYAKPGYNGSLDTQSIINAGMQYWAIASNETNPRIDPYPVRVNAETAVIEPSTTLTLTGDDRGELGTSGSVTLNFRAVARFDGGTYNATTQPSVLRYDMEGSPLSGGTRENNITEKSWSRTFTSPGTYRIGARAQKNWCPPDVAVDNNCAGKVGAVDIDYINVTITEPNQGTKPTATIRQEMSYSTELNGCGYGIAGTGIAVTCTTTIDLTQGTGNYVWDDVTTTTGNWVKNGNTLQQTITRRATSENNYSGSFGTQVIFKKNGQEVHRDGSGTATWCINIVRLNIDPNNPNPSPDFDRI